jgi:Domain of unknown function (DUF4384)
MNPRKWIGGLIGSLFLLCTPAWAQSPDGIRGGWLKSRPVPAKRPKPRPPSSKPPGNSPSPTVFPTRLNALGLGYTLFLMNPAGDLVRTRADRPFKSGDRVCLLVEVNRDGYLYIFNQENNQPPKLLFPNAHVAGGANQVRAHQTVWLPEKGEIEFDESPGQESLVLVFSESKLANLAPSTKPEGDAVEARVFQEAARETVVRADNQPGPNARMTPNEGKRGVRLNLSDPAPAFLLVNQDAAQTRIVARIQLTHR